MDQRLNSVESIAKLVEDRMTALGELKSAKDMIANLESANQSLHDGLMSILRELEVLNINEPRIDRLVTAIKRALTCGEHDQI
jgi:hypothetical protein